MKLKAWCLAALLATAASSGLAVDAAKNPWDRHSDANAAAVKLGESDCKAQQGEWVVPEQGEPFCALVPADAGKICRSGSQCEIACVSKVDPRYAKTPFVVGECLRTTRRDGCYFYVEGGRVAHAYCKE